MSNIGNFIGECKNDEYLIKLMNLERKCIYDLFTMAKSNTLA